MPKILHSLLPKSLHFWLPFTITNALVRNGLDRIECLVMHDASVISQKTRLGPKRMQMIEGALKSYAPGLGFGMYKI